MGKVEGQAAKGELQVLPNAAEREHFTPTGAVCVRARAYDLRSLKTTLGP